MRFWLERNCQDIGDFLSPSINGGPAKATGREAPVDMVEEFPGKLIGGDLSTPEDDVVGGSNHAENVNQLLARLAFLEALTEDQGVVDLWWAWGQDTGLNDSASALGRAIDQLAVSAGLEHPAEIRKIYDTGSEAEVAALEESFNPDLVEIADEALAEFGLCLDRAYSLRQQMSDEATVFVRDTLRLQWPWLTLELIECFEYSCVAFSSGLTLRLQAKAEEKEPLARETTELRRSYRDNVVIRGRLPTDEEAEFQDGVGKYARWFYRNRLRRESIGHIAQSDDYDPDTIRRGIGEVERLLGLT